MHRIAVLGTALLVGISLLGAACTFFSYDGNDLVLFGNSEDYALLPVYAWYVPSSPDEYACLFVGFDTGFAQGGMNSAGLAFDAASIPEVRLTDHPELPYPDPMNFCELVLRQCATVDEAVELIGAYNLSYVGVAQFQFADRTGASVVISPGPRRELEFIYTESPYQVTTNTNTAYYPESHKNRLRHQAATAVLEEIEAGAAELSVGSFERALDAVARKSGPSETMYSNIFDLTYGVAYIYYRHDFESPAILQMSDLQAANREVVYQIADLASGAD